MPGKVITTRGGTAVMQNKSPKELTADDPQTALWRTLNYFPTPPWGTRAGAEVAKRLWPAAQVVREPAAGGGHMAGPLREFFPIVLESDVHGHRRGLEVRDWLDEAAWDDEPDCDLIMTNPPFEVAARFVTMGLRRARLGVALLLRIAFLEGGDRYQEVFADGQLTQVATFCERLPMVLGKWDPTVGSATCYAWFFFSKSKRQKPMPPAWFPPGTRDRLWRQDDVERYAFRPPLPLFPEA